MIRVGIEFAFFDDSWIGGVSAIANLISALRQLEHPKVEPVLIAGPKTPNYLLERMADVEVLRTNLIDNCQWSNFVGRSMRRLIGRNLLLEGWLKRNGIDVYSHGMPLGKYARIPTIGHIADFSYKYFAELYEPEVFARKDEGTARICNEYDFLLLSSRAVEADYRKFFPAASAQSVVLNIVPSELPEQVSSKAEVTAKYQLPDRYIFSPNQFWVHKNHLTIIEAISIANAAGRTIHVVCTGRQNDERRPEHFNLVMRRARELGVADQFHALGLVPYEDTIDLMRHSTALLSASLFEGWGISVSEGKMLGKALLLSDIPVFREQAPERARYFDPKDSEALARYLVEADESYSESEDKMAAAEQRKLWPSRIRHYAETFETIVINAGRR